jgi:uncharacterized RDD family membrane protein YckC
MAAGFWRRVAAAWIDLSLLYATSSFLIAVAATLGLRLALEPVGLVLGAGYGVFALNAWGRTAGKRLLNLEVVARNGGHLPLIAIVIREVIGKWGLLVAAPALVGRLLLGTTWVPTAFDLLAILALGLITAVGHALTGSVWYDQLARTRVIRSAVDAAGSSLAFLTVAAMAVLGMATKGLETAIQGHVPSRTLLYHRMGSVQPYLGYLQKPHANAKDYVLGLFDRYDVVVLCEREHSEMTQWDFIYDVVSDPRFSRRVGHVFTELGQTGMQSYLDEFMAADGLSEREVNERVLHVLRNWSVWPRWNRVNFPSYLSRLYALNRSLPPEQRIRHHLTDVGTDWSSLTADDMPRHWRALAHRDGDMARVVLEEMKRLDSAGRPAKGLVVMNFRHAFDLTAGAAGAARHNTFEFLRDALGRRVANVRINESFLWPTAGGLWDAAFTRLGNQPVGFDLAGSPFGEEPFDLVPWAPQVRGRLTYQQVFTGFVFVQPPRAQYSLDGIPGYYAGWEDEARRRASLVGPDYLKMVEKEIALEKRGKVPVRAPHVAFQVESGVEAVLGGGCSLGFVVGLAAFLLRHRDRAPLPQARTAPVPAARRIRWRWWLALAAAIVGAVSIHEIGHCVVAWMNGYVAIPTPAKEYLLSSPTPAVQKWIDLGGVVGSVVTLLGAMAWLRRRPDATRSALLAGALTLPGAYALRFWLAGRGHDGTEFQEAQAALGLSPSGHALDWFFVGLVVTAVGFWIWHTRPRLSLRLVGRVLLGAVTALLVLVVLQVTNNAVFDPLLQR